MIFCKQFCQSQPTPTHTPSVRPKDQMLLGQAFCAVGSPEITIHNQRAADKLMKFMGTCVAKYLCTKTFFGNSQQSELGLEIVSEAMSGQDGARKFLALRRHEVVCEFKLGPVIANVDFR